MRLSTPWITFAGVALALTLLAEPAAADPGAVRVIRSTRMLDAQGRPVGTIRAGELYVARAEREGKLRFDVDGRSVWLPWSQFEPAPEGVIGITPRLTRLSVHSEPSGDAPRLGTMLEGQRYVRAGAQGSWLKVRFEGGRYGWVYSPMARGAAVPPAVAPVGHVSRTVPRSAPGGLAGSMGTVIRLGDRGEHVVRMQRDLNKRLKALGLPEISETGVVDQATLEAMRRNNSKQSATNAKRRGGTLMGVAKTNHTNLAAGGGGGALPAELSGGRAEGGLDPQGAPKTVALPTLGKGDSGAAVRMLQVLLNHTLRKTTGSTEITITGKFDASTEAAVAALQKRKGLSVSGSADASLWSLLHKELKTHPLGTIKPLTLPTSDDRYGRLTSRVKDVALHRLPARAKGQPEALLYESKFTIHSDRLSGAPAPSSAFVVVPRDFAKTHPDFKAYDLAAVIYRGRVAFATCVPVGSTTRIGAGSLGLARELGVLPAGDREAGVITIVFPGSGKGRAQTAKDVARRGAELLRRNGGRP